MIRADCPATRTTSSYRASQRAGRSYVLLAAVFVAFTVLPVQSEDLSAEVSEGRDACSFASLTRKQCHQSRSHFPSRVLN